MRFASTRRIIIFGLVFWVALAVYQPIAADEHDSLPPLETDTIFTEIVLSNEGVTAVDSSGNEWYYDFEQECFVPGQLQQETSDRDAEYDRSGDLTDLPIAERCVEEIEIEPFEKKNVKVGVDQYVDGDIMTSGRVTVAGWVKGDITSLGKKVRIKPTGRVEGSIKAPQIVVEDGGIVRGRIIEDDSIIDIEDFRSTFSASGLIIVLAFSVILLAITFLITALLPHQMARFASCANSHPVRTYFLGLLLLILMPLVFTLVAVTVIGLLVVPLIPFLYLTAIGMGAIAFGDRIGKQVISRHRGSQGHPMLQALTGVTLLMSLWLITAILMGSSDDTSHGFGIFFLVVSILISTIPLCTGIGAAALTRFGFKSYRSWAERQQVKTEPPAPTPAPPPIPDRPGVPSSGPDPLSGPRPPAGHSGSSEETSPPFSPGTRAPRPTPPPSSETNEDDLS